MPRFFIPHSIADSYTIAGPDAIHILRSLRMRTGEALTLCDPDGMDYACEIVDHTCPDVSVKVLSKAPCPNEPTVKISLFQGLPKGDKPENIVKAAVQLGVSDIYFCVTARTVSRPDPKAAVKKQERLQTVAREAAMQSERGRIPTVHPITSFKEALPVFLAADLSLAFYEKGGESLSGLLSKDFTSVNIFIGPEGGFEEEEIDKMVQSGAVSATLGPRILRTETAPAVAISSILFATGNMD